ncbi:MAG: hypothetical protein Q8K30_06065 [Candidatus Gracilibacteria bacterium]|nr:hypothetical protein [Candidatus Gracilibacteria bacterium]
MGKIILWSNEKNEILKKTRGICFEDVLSSEIIDDLEHPNKEKYPNQRIMIVEIDGYPYVCPYIENKNEIFLKTLFPDRRYKK